jgi:hypothetical protein
MIITVFSITVTILFTLISKKSDVIYLHLLLYLLQTLNLFTFTSICYTILKDVIAAVPPHWSKGVTSAKGSRWAGAVSEAAARL